MLKAERQDRIVEMCRVRGTVSVHEIATTLGVSDMTVRRDLEELSEEGRIERPDRHKRVCLVRVADADGGFVERMPLDIPVKR